jgi:hypothetical protein
MALTGFVDAEGLRGLRMVTCATAACSTACSSFANERTSSPIPGEGVYQSWARSTIILIIVLGFHDHFENWAKTHRTR